MVAGSVLGSPLVAVLAKESFSGVGLGDGTTIKSQLSVQATSFAITVLWTAVASYAILKIAAMIGGLRVDNDTATEVLDPTQMVNVSITITSFNLSKIIKTCLR